MHSKTQKQGMEQYSTYTLKICEYTKSFIPQQFLYYSLHVTETCIVNVIELILVVWLKTREKRVGEREECRIREWERS